MTTSKDLKKFQKAFNSPKKHGDPYRKWDKDFQMDGKTWVSDTNTFRKNMEKLNHGNTS